MPWNNEADQYYKCHVLGHSWFDTDVIGTPLWGTPFALKCERCGMIRQDVIDRAGNLSTRRYIRPEHYNYQRGERPSMAEFRLIYVENALAAILKPKPKGVDKLPKTEAS